MKSANLAAVGLMAAAVASSSAVAVAGQPGPYVDTGGVCSHGPRGWTLRNHRGMLVACRPLRHHGLGWEWREDGGRAGWYDPRDRRWR
jgi:hypothetical protein